MKTLFNIHPTKAIYNIPLKYDKILGKELIFYSQGNTFHTCMLILFQEDLWSMDYLSGNDICISLQLNYFKSNLFIFNIPSHYNKAKKKYMLVYGYPTYPIFGRQPIVILFPLMSEK